MPNYPQKIANWFLDVVFPKVCVGCGKFTSKNDFSYICKKCFGKIDTKNALECIGCKRETRFGLTCAFCSRDNKIDQLIIAADLSNDLVNKILRVYKYKFITDLALPLTIIAKKSIKKLASRGFNLFGDNPLLVPVTLHKKRFNERGFNQSWLITKALADAFHVSCNEDVLCKKFNPKHQADIKSRQERSANMKNNFSVNKPELVRNRIMIVVDDICTSGATLNECAKVLKKSGAKKVIGFVIARGKFK